MYEQHTATFAGTYIPSDGFDQSVELVLVHIQELARADRNDVFQKITTGAGDPCQRRRAHGHALSQYILQTLLLLGAEPCLPAWKLGSRGRRELR